MREASDQRRIDNCKDDIEVTVRKLANAREQHRLLGLGIVSIEERLAEGREKLRLLEEGDTVERRRSRDDQQL